MKALVGAFNQEKAIVGPSSWLWNLREPSFNLRFKLYHLRLILVVVLGWGREGWCASRWEPGAGHLTLGWALGDNLLFPFLKKVSQQWPMTHGTLWNEERTYLKYPALPFTYIFYVLCYYRDTIYSTCWSFVWVRLVTGVGCLMLNS